MLYSTKVNQNCLYCRSQYLGHSNSKFCCSGHSKLFSEQIKIGKSHEIFGNHNTDCWVECPECGLRSAQLGISHMKKHGFLRVNEVKEKYPNWKSISHKTAKNMSIRMTGDKNPGFNHRGKLSPFSINFVGYCGEDAKEKISNLAKTMSEKRSINGNSTTTIEYYIKRGASTEEAKSALKKRQQTFNLKKLQDKYGLEEGLRIWKDRQTRWQYTLNLKTDEEKSEINRKKLYRNGKVSKTEEKFVSMLRESVSELETQFIIKKDETHNYLYDVKVGNIIIEFNGSFWHANPQKYKETDIINFPGNKNISAKDIWARDFHKISAAENLGYKVITIWDLDFKEDPQNTIKRCLDFIKQNDSTI